MIFSSTGLGEKNSVFLQERKMIKGWESSYDVVVGLLRQREDSSLEPGWDGGYGEN